MQVLRERAVLGSKVRAPASLVQQASVVQPRGARGGRAPHGIDPGVADVVSQPQQKDEGHQEMSWRRMGLI